MVYACFVAKMSKMAFTRFGGQFQFEKSMLGRLDNSGAGAVKKPEVKDPFSGGVERPSLEAGAACQLSGEIERQPKDRDLR